MSEPSDTRRFELRHTQGVEVSSQDLLADLQRFAAERGRSTVAFREYQSDGHYHPSTMMRRFGSWNEALKQAGLEISNEMTIDTDRLFENLEGLWIALGRQPTKRDLGTPRSEFSEGPYNRTFGSWRNALSAFVSWANAADLSAGTLETAAVTDDHKDVRRVTPRDPNLRTRFLVMKRDGFRCRYCGKSPATDAGVELVLDHIKAWSKGGETTPENLATSCVTCNAGKSNT